MKTKILIFIIFIALQLSAQTYKQIHADAILIDTHNDILTKTVDNGYIMDTDLKGKTHSDLKRWKEGGLDVQIFSVFCGGEKVNPYLYANRQMDSLDAVVKRNPDKIVKVANSKALQKVVHQGKLAAMFGVEGGHMIENDLNKLDSFYKRGARYMTLTWNNSNSWATSAYDESFTTDLTHKGLTDFGKEVVKRMNKLGMLVDISHVGLQTFWDVINTSTKPVIASHSSVYTLCQHHRNLNDDQIKAIAKNGGVIQINFFSGFLDNKYFKNKDLILAEHSHKIDSLTALGISVEQGEKILDKEYKKDVEDLRVDIPILIQNIEYIIKLVGIDYVGLGSDFDGIESTPKGLDDVTDYPLITKALIEKGYNKHEINKILGGNFLRVLKANEEKL